MCFHSVAARLLEKKSVVFKNQTLLISEPRHSVDSTAMPRTVTDQTHHYMHTIKVTNVEPTLSKEMLRLYFESAKHSHGGEVKDLTLITEKKKAFIAFKDPNGMSIQHAMTYSFCVCVFCVHLHVEHH